MRRAAVTFLSVTIMLIIAAPAFAQDRGAGALNTVRRVFGERYGGGWIIPDRGFGVRIVGVTVADKVRIQRLADRAGVEVEILPANYSRREIVKFMDIVDRNIDDPNLDPIIGWGPDDTLGKLGIDIETPGVTTVRKLYSLFPTDAIHVECCAPMGSFFDPPTWFGRSRDVAIVVMALGVIVLFVSRATREDAAAH